MQKEEEEVNFIVDEVVIEEENDESILFTGIRKTKIIDVLDHTDT